MGEREGMEVIVCLLLFETGLLHWLITGACKGWEGLVRHDPNTHDRGFGTRCSIDQESSILGPKAVLQGSAIVLFSVECLP